MTLQMVIPLFGGKADAKDLVITILSSEYPLNAREVFFIARNKFGAKQTYQSIHKALVGLEEDDVVVKQGREYLLSDEWMKKITEFAEQTKKQYEKQPESRERKKGSQFTFYTPIDALYFALGVMHEDFKTNPPKKIIA